MYDTRISQSLQRLQQQFEQCLPPDSGALIFDSEHRILTQTALCQRWFGDIFEGQTLLNDAWFLGLGIHLSDREYRTLSIDRLLQTGQPNGYIGLAFSKETRWVRYHLQTVDSSELPLQALVLTDVSDLFRDLQGLQQKAEDASTHDFTTRLYNRRYVLERLEQMHQHAKRYHTSFTVAMIDIDHFKRINDTFGHSFGDEVLSRLADVIRKSFRETDLCGRFGGEEFLILMPETDTREAVLSLDRLRQQISELKWEQMQRPVTVSSGVISWQSNKSVEQLIFQADQRLATAKKAGRNQVCGDLI